MPIQRGKEPLRLIRWHNDHCPPIDFNDLLRDILDLIKETKRLREEVDFLNAKIRGMNK